MYLVKLHPKDGSGKSHNIVFEKVPQTHIFLKDKLYTMVNNQLISDSGYKQTYYYTQVNYENLDK